MNRRTTCGQVRRFTRVRFADDLLGQQPCSALLRRGELFKFVFFVGDNILESVGTRGFSVGSCEPAGH